MVKFKLPKGYSFTPPADVQGVTVPGYSPYGGADISQAFDAAGAHWVGCNANGPGTPAFRWRVFRKLKGANSYVEMPLPFLATGRGELSIQEDGKLHAIAWNGSAFEFGVVEGFASFVPSPARAPILIPPNGHIAALWHGVYTAADFDTPAETAVRVGKQLDAFHELMGLLEAGGVVRRG